MAQAFRFFSLFLCVGFIAVSGQESSKNGAPKPGDTGTPSLLERFNTRLPGWVHFSGELRERGEGYAGGGFRPASSDVYDLHRLRLGLTVQPSRWFKMYAETQDARALQKRPALPPYQNTFDLRQAYVELGNREGIGMSLLVGRQVLEYGDGRLVGESNWTNVARAFDAVRGIFQHGKYRADVFAASVVVVRDGVLDHHNQGTNLHGVYGSLKDVIPNSTLEPFTLWRLQPGVATEEGVPGHLNQHTHGVRLVGKLPVQMDYQLEMALQRGRLGVERIEAWTGHWVIAKTIPQWRAKPRPFLEFNYASGDHQAKDGVSNTFDPLYPSSHDKTGLADQFAYRNIQDLRLGADIKVNSRLLITPSFHDFWLANRHDGLYSARGTVIGRRLDGTAGSHVGEEFDIQATCRASRQAQFGFGYSRIFTGEFLNRTTAGKDYSFPYVMLRYVL